MAQKNDRKEREQQVGKDGSVNSTTALLMGGICDVSGQRAIEKEITQHSHIFIPLFAKGCEVNQGEACSYPAYQRLRWCLLGFFSSDTLR